MFGKRADPSDFRVHTRYSAANLTIVLDGEVCTLHDYSEGGVRISSQTPTRRVALIEVYKGDKCIRKSPAIVAWRRNDQAGYAFRSNLKICEVENAARYQQHRTQPAGSETNATGAVTGKALRRRLKI